MRAYFEFRPLALLLKTQGSGLKTPPHLSQILTNFTILAIFKHFPETHRAILRGFHHPRHDSCDKQALFSLRPHPHSEFTDSFILNAPSHPATVSPGHSLSPQSPFLSTRHPSPPLHALTTFNQNPTLSSGITSPPATHARLPPALQIISPHLRSEISKFEQWIQ